MATPRLHLVADIGATHARFALLDSHGRPDRVSVVATADHPGLGEAIAAFLATRQLDSQDHQEMHAAIAVAGPITGDRVRLTNHPWTFSIDAVRRQAGFAKLVVINDLEAVALALPELPEDAYEVIGTATPTADGPKAVLGIGTGFGAAYLVPAGRGEPHAWRAFASEAGHAALPPHDALEIELLSRLSQGPEPATIEHALSGSGLVTLYRALAEQAGDVSGQAPASPRAVVEAAGSGDDRLAARTLRIFSGLLGGVAGDLALCYGARGGIYLTGGVLTRMGPLFDRAEFRVRFEARVSMRAYLSGIATCLIRAEYPALLGLARLLDHESRL